jgi:hypothetical protein
VPKAAEPGIFCRKGSAGGLEGKSQQRNPEVAMQWKSMDGWERAHGGAGWLGLHPFPFTWMDGLDGESAK